MLIGQCSPARLARQLRGEGLNLDTGAFGTRLRIDVPELIDEFAAVYADYPVFNDDICDFRVRIAAPSPLRRFIRPQVTSWIDGVQHIEPLPAQHSLPCLESSLNLAVALHDVAPLVVHAAVLERDGRALVMPAPSGSGKSTLCAALAWRGWRLMSDEMTIFCFETGRLLANPRPVSLKNRSMEAVAGFEPRAQFSRVFRGTNKGDIAYMRPPADAVARRHESAGPGLIVAPMFRAGAPLSVRPMSRVEALRWLTDNSINYASMLQRGFELVADLVEDSGRYTLSYSKLDEAVEALDELHRKHV